MCTVKVHHIAELVVWCLLSRYWRLAVVARCVQWRCTTVQSYSCEVCCTGTGGHSHGTKVCAVKVCHTAELFMWHLLYRYWRPAMVPRCVPWRDTARQYWVYQCTGRWSPPLQMTAPAASSHPSRRPRCPKCMSADWGGIWIHAWCSWIGSFCLLSFCGFQISIVNKFDHKSTEFKWWWRYFLRIVFLWLSNINF